MLKSIVDFNEYEFNAVKHEDIMYIRVIDIMEYFGFANGSGEYSFINNRGTSGFTYLKTKFNGGKRENNCITLDSFGDYLIKLSNKNFRNDPPVLFHDKLDYMLRHKDVFIGKILNSFEVSPPEKQEEPISETPETPPKDLAVPKDVEPVTVQEVPDDSVKSEDDQEEENNESIDIKVKSQVIDADKFLVMYEQLDSYGQRHLLELLENSDRKIIHNILDEEYFTKGDRHTKYRIK